MLERSTIQKVHRHATVMIAMPISCLGARVLGNEILQLGQIDYVGIAAS